MVVQNVLQLVGGTIPTAMGLFTLALSLFSGKPVLFVGGAIGVGLVLFSGIVSYREARNRGK
ncbi:hypothetical protein BG842_22725 [Haladaptatus sp. W1]|uniref:hypothetical protein n=1 Tax=Haladaptatus sp. W1 TaxID=1897478 RepID=UPI000849D502|nr:hypothetical protein [Haladaptatus sp. W1]ODR81375.1 hypothetical protein BG842_22725 [Haladaptatus sp. W1]